MTHFAPLRVSFHNLYNYQPASRLQKERFSNLETLVMVKKQSKRGDKRKRREEKMEENVVEFVRRIQRKLDYVEKREKEPQISDDQAIEIIRRIAERVMRMKDISGIRFRRVVGIARDIELLTFYPNGKITVGEGLQRKGRSGEWQIYDDPKKIWGEYHYSELETFLKSRESKYELQMMILIITDPETVIEARDRNGEFKNTGIYVGIRPDTLHFLRA